MNNSKIWEILRKSLVGAAFASSKNEDLFLRKLSGVKTSFVPYSFMMTFSWDALVMLELKQFSKKLPYVK